MNSIDLSIIIVSYNTAELTKAAVKSVLDTVKESSFEVIVVDNNSSDESVAVVNELKSSRVKVLENKENLGFSKANNVGIKESSGRYVLFLNPDTVVHEKTLDGMVAFMDGHPSAGASTCKLETPDGSIDYASHRGFPTPWNSLTYFSGLNRLFPRSKVFAGYTQGWKNLNTIHEVDAIAGAFLLTRREAGEQIGWWDEDYFFNGEDLDFCFELRDKGWKIFYVPTFSILHYNGMAGGTKKQSAKSTTATKETRIRAQESRFNAMKIFYQKHYQNKYPKIVTQLVYSGIDLKKYITKKRLGL